VKANRPHPPTNSDSFKGLAHTRAETDSCRQLQARSAAHPFFGNQGAIAQRSSLVLTLDRETITRLESAATPASGANRRIRHHPPAYSDSSQI
jgi:hypothetical protein